MKHTIETYGTTRTDPPIEEMNERQLGAVEAIHRVLQRDAERVLAAWEPQARLVPASIVDISDVHLSIDIGDSDSEAEWKSAIDYSKSEVISASESLYYGGFGIIRGGSEYKPR